MEKIIFNVEVDSTQATKNALELTKQLRALRAQKVENMKAQKELAGELRKGTISVEAYEKELNDLIASELKLEREIKGVSKELNNQKKEAVIVANSLAALRIENRKLIEQATHLNLATAEGQEEFAGLSEQILANSEAIKAAENAMGNFTSSVGDYRNKVKDALIETGNLGGALGGTAGEFGQMAGKVVAATGPIGALIAAVGLLFSAFTKTSGGAVKMEQVMGGLSGVFNSVIGLIGNFVGNIGNLDLSLANIGNVITENLTNRFSGVIKTFGLLGDGISALVSGDFEKLKTVGKDAANSIVQSITGVENLASKASDFLTEAYKDGENLVKNQQALAYSTRALEVEVAKLTAQYEQKKQIADNDTLSMKERQKAEEEAAAISMKLGEAQIGLEKNKLAVTNQEIALRKKQGLDYRDLLDAQTQGIIAVQNAEGELEMRRLERSEANRKRERDELEMRLDILMDASDATKASLERQVGMTGESVESRLELLEKLKKGQIKLSEIEARSDAKAAESLEKRKKLAADAEKVFENSTKAFISEIETYLGKSIEADAILAEKDAIKQERMIRAMGLDEIVNTRLLEFVKEKTAAEIDYVDMKIQLTDEEIELETKKLEKLKEAEAQRGEVLRMRFENEKTNIEARNELLDFEMQQELEKYANNQEAQVEIKKKYELAKTEISKTQKEAELELTENLLGQAASLFKENTIAYKILASAEIVMSTQQAAMAAYAAAAKVEPFVLPIIASGLAIAAGAASLAKVNEIQFADGGLLRGASHANGGIKGITKDGLRFEAEGGEFFTNTKSTAMSLPALETINANPNIEFEAVPKYEMGGILGSDIKAMIDMGNQPTIQYVLPVSELRKVEKRIAVSDRIATV